MFCRCREDTFAEVDRAVKIWAMLGGLGARSNRAAGSVWFRQNAPETFTEFQQSLRGLNLPTAWDIQIAPVSSLEEGRVAASDTVKVERFFGGINPRKSSPIKFKLIELGQVPHLLMFAPSKELWPQALEALRHPLGGGSPKKLSALDWQSVV